MKNAFNLMDRFHWFLFQNTQMRGIQMVVMKKMCRIVTVMSVVGFLSVGCSLFKDYPNQQIDGIIAWGVDGGTDISTRMLTPIAEKALGETINLVNKTGATGSIATQAVFDKKADGYTLLFNAENPQLYTILGLSKLTYDDFEPILLSVQGSTVIVVPRLSPFKTYADLIKAAKAKPGKLTIGITGVGGQPYVTAQILKKVEDVTFNQVAFDGDGSLSLALQGKKLDVSGLAVGAAVQYIRNGSVRALAIMQNSPNTALPDVPYISKLNPKYTSILKASGFFYGVWVKKGTPKTAIDKLTAAFKTAFNDKSFQEYAKFNGLTTMGISGQEAKEFVKAWQSQMAWLIFDSGGAKESPDKFGIPKPTF
jgi:tripartite-type tricarboxylate transporter receptor subunit TctC